MKIASIDDEGASPPPPVSPPALTQTASLTDGRTESQVLWVRRRRRRRQYGGTRVGVAVAAGLTDCNVTMRGTHSTNTTTPSPASPRLLLRFTATPVRVSPALTSSPEKVSLDMGYVNRTHTQRDDDDEYALTGEGGSF
ncbi:hypothetical protein CBL_05859 [Carabus blaptoides fortunei]